MNAIADRKRHILHGNTGPRKLLVIDDGVDKGRVVWISLAGNIRPTNEPIWEYMVEGDFGNFGANVDQKLNCTHRDVIRPLLKIKPTEESDFPPRPEGVIPEPNPMGSIWEFEKYATTNGRQAVQVSRIISRSSESLALINSAWLISTRASRYA